MANPGEIKIQIDEEALREQVSRALGDALKEAAAKFRWAANDLDPEFMKRFEEDSKQYWRKEWEKEQDAKKDM